MITEHRSRRRSAAPRSRRLWISWTRKLALLAVLSLATGCWTTQTEVIQRDSRHWSTPVVVEEDAVLRHDTRLTREGDSWFLDLEVEVADYCQSEYWREVEEVNLIDRATRGPEVAATLVAGIITCIGVGAGTAYVGLNNPEGPDGQPINADPETGLIVFGVGEGIGGGMILSGIGVIDVTRRGNGHHERVLSSWEQNDGLDGRSVPCSWAPVASALGTLRAGEMALPVEVRAGQAHVELPTPSAETGFVLALTLEGFPEAADIVLTDTAYDREARRLLTAQLLDDGDIHGARATLVTIPPDAEGYADLLERFEEQLFEAVDEALAVNALVEAVSLAKLGADVLLDADASAMIEEAMGQMIKQALAEDDLPTALQAAAELRDLLDAERPATQLVVSTVEGRFVALLQGLDDVDAYPDQGPGRDFISQVGGLMGAGWVAAAVERHQVALTLRLVELSRTSSALLEPEAESAGPVQVASLLAVTATALLEGRELEAPAYPADVQDALDQLGSRAETLFDPARLTRTYADHWGRSQLEGLPRAVATLIREEAWLEAFRTLEPVFGARAGFESFRGHAQRVEIRLAEWKRQNRDFMAFAEDWVEVMAARELGRSAPRSLRSRIGQPELDYWSCRRGMEYLEHEGADAYRTQAKILCLDRFPSTWTWGEGTDNEYSTDVSVRTCESFFAAPPGCRR
jgi:hypothetical protein